MDIEKKIEKDLNNYHIKTRSEDILARLPQKKPKKKFNFKLAISFASIAAVAACCLIAVIMLNPFTTKPQNEKPNTVDNHYLTQTTTNVSKLSLQLFYGGSIATSINANTSNGEIAGAYTDNDVNAIVSNIEKSFNAIDQMYMHENGLEYSYSKNDFNYDSVQYNYLLTVGEYKLYLEKDVKFDEEEKDDEEKDDDEDEEEMELEWESPALIQFGDKYYTGSIEMEMEGSETSVELIYFDKDYTYSIAKDKEKKEYSIEYSVYYTGNLIETFELELKYSSDNKFKCDYEYEKPDDGILIEIETIKNASGYKFKYKESIFDEIKYEIEDIELKVNGNSRVYKIQDKYKEIK